MVFEEEGNCIVCLEIRADELMRHLISGELANYRLVRTSPKPLQLRAWFMACIHTHYDSLWSIFPVLDKSIRLPTPVVHV
jgi:hypothetical protein